MHGVGKALDTMECALRGAQIGQSEGQEPVDQPGVWILTNIPGEGVHEHVDISKYRPAVGHVGPICSQSAADFEPVAAPIP
jgi:hypothetical protein